MYRVSKMYRNLRLNSRVFHGTVIGLILISIIFVASILNFRISNIVNSWEGKVYNGVSINGVDVSGLSKVSLSEFLLEEFSEPTKEGKVKFTLGDKVLEVSYKELGLTYDYDKAIVEAFNFSEDFSYYEKVNQIFNPKKSLNITLEEKFDANKVIDILYEKLSNTFNVSPVDAKASIVNGQVVVTESSSGIEVDKEALIKMINDSTPNSASQNGFEVPTKSVDPRISSDVLGKINGKLGSYTTTFKSSSKERATNVELSANVINGVLLMPGESFSFNKTVGPRTRERGYKDAAIIVGDVYESGLGGGICQTSSTLHQAVIRSGIIPTQRKNHSLPTSYMPLGFDAVVAWGSLDYVFKNPYDFPILIDVSTANRTLTISIYGDVTLVDKTYSMESETYESVPYTTKEVKDNTLSKGQKVVKKNGVNGTKVNVYLLVSDKQTGKLLEKKLLWKDYYLPQQKVVHVGTK